MSDFQHPDAPSLLLGCGGGGSNTKTRPGKSHSPDQNQTFTHPSLGSELVRHNKGKIVPSVPSNAKKNSLIAEMGRFMTRVSSV